MRRTRRSRIAITTTVSALVTLGSLAALTSPAFASGQPFTAGDLAVYTVATTFGAKSSAAQPVFIDEYSPSGSSSQPPVQSIPLPTTTTGSQSLFTDSGSATSAGALTLSGNGQYLVAAGYGTAVATASVTSKSTVGVVARIDSLGNVDTSTTFNAASNNVRGAYSPDGTSLYVTGGANGVGSETFGGSSATPLDASVTNLRSVTGTGSQLYVSGSPTVAGNTPSITIASVGTGFPTTGGQSVGNLPGISSTADPYQFVLLAEGGSTPNVLYYADGTLGAIEKYSLNNGTWVAEGSIAVPSSAGGVLYGLTGQVSTGGNVQLYATSSTSTGTSGYLYAATDTTGLGTASGTASLLASAPSGYAFRGVAFVPQGSPNGGATPEVANVLFLPVLATLGFGGFVIVRRRRRLA